MILPVQLSAAWAIQPRLRFGLAELPRQGASFLHVEDHIDKSLMALIDEPFVYGLTRRDILRAVFSAMANRKPKVDEINGLLDANHQEAMREYDRKMARRDIFPVINWVTLPPEKPKPPRRRGLWVRHSDVVDHITRHLKPAYRRHVEEALKPALEQMEAEGLLAKSRFDGDDEKEYALAALIGERTWHPTAVVMNLKQEILKA